jgi:hypothetical protein
LTPDINTSPDRPSAPVVVFFFLFLRESLNASFMKFLFISSVYGGSPIWVSNIVPLSHLYFIEQAPKRVHPYPRFYVVSIYLTFHYIPDGCPKLSHAVFSQQCPYSLRLSYYLVGNYTSTVDV